MGPLGRIAQEFVRQNRTNAMTTIAEATALVTSATKAVANLSRFAQDSKFATEVTAVNSLVFQINTVVPKLIEETQQAELRAAKLEKDAPSLLSEIKSLKEEKIRLEALVAEKDKKIHELDKKSEELGLENLELRAKQYSDLESGDHLEQ
jgi:vacuolar-type H+-ATPase subunit I/STV1